MAVRLGTSEVGGTFYSQAEALLELFNRDRPKSEACVIEPTSASIDNANRLHRGEIQFGFMASNWIGRARDGEGPFNEKISLRMVAPANAGPMFFVTLADSSVRSTEDFRGKRIALGPRSSGMVQHSEIIFDVLEISFESFTPVYLGFAEGAEALIRGEIDVQFQCPIPNRVMTDLSESADVRVVEYPSADLERVLAAVPFYRKAIMEQGVFRGVDQNSPQIGVVNVIVTHEKVPESTVYELAKSIALGLDELPRLNSLYKGLRALFDPLRSEGAAAFEFGGVPLHPGALRAFKESGWLR